MKDQPEESETDETGWEPRVQAVPSTWLLAEFRDAFAPVSVNQRKVPAKKYKATGSIPIVDQGQAFIGGYTDDETLGIDPGEGLIVFGDHTRVFKRVSFPFAAGADGIKVLRPVLCDSKYAYYACRSLQFPNRGYSRHYSFLTRCKLPIAPNNEQKRIVSKIDELFSRIDDGESALARVQGLVEHYRLSVLKAAVTGELTREWREKNKGRLESGEALLARVLKARREAWETAELEKMKAKGITPANEKWKKKYEEPSSPNTTDLPQLPKTWIWASVEQLSGFVTSGSRGWAEYYAPEGALFLRVGNLQRLTTRFDLSKKQFVNAPNSAEGSRTRTKTNDLVISITADVGMSGVISPELADSYVNQHLSLVRPVDESLGPWMAWAVASPVIQSEIRALKQGATKDGLTLDDVRAIQIPIPPYPEIAELVSRMERMSDSGIRAAKEAHQEGRVAAALRQAILKSAFIGALTKQDPADGPATQLLERVAAQSGTIEGAPKRGRKKESAA